MPSYSRDLRLIRQAELALIESPLGLYDMVRYQAGLRGRLRHLAGLLCLACCRAVEGSPERGLPAAVALDMAYASLELHGRLWTRPLPAPWRRWGRAQAINAGDALLTLARLSLLDLEMQGATPDQVSEALRLMEVACLRDAGGQRTGNYYRCAAEMGAMLGGAAGAARQRLGSFGASLGMAVIAQGQAWTGDGQEAASSHFQETLGILEAELSPSRQGELRGLAAFAMGERGKRSGP